MQGDKPRAYSNLGELDCIAEEDLFKKYVSIQFLLQQNSNYNENTSIGFQMRTSTFTLRTSSGPLKKINFLHVIIWLVSNYLKDEQNLIRKKLVCRGKPIYQDTLEVSMKMGEIITLVLHCSVFYVANFNALSHT